MASHLLRRVAIVIDLTPVREKANPASILKMLEGRSKKVFRKLLYEQPPPFRESFDDFVRDVLTGCTSIATEQVPAAAGHRSLPRRHSDRTSTGAVSRFDEVLEADEHTEVDTWWT